MYDVLDEDSNFTVRMFRGVDLYPHIRKAIVDKYKFNLRRRHLVMAKESKMRLSDYLIAESTIQIANTEIARRLYRDRIIKHYPKNAEFIRILK